MELSQKLQKVLERLDNRIKALQVAYYDKLTEDACLYYFYYNENKQLYFLNDNHCHLNVVI